MFFIAYTFKGQVHVFAGRVKTVIHSSCMTSAILNYFCPLQNLSSAAVVIGNLRVTLIVIQSGKHSKSWTSEI